MEAAIGRVALEQLDQWNQNRREHATFYSERLIELTDVNIPLEKEWAHHIYLHYPIRVPARRDQLQDFLEAQEIETAVPYDPPIPFTQLFMDRFNFKEGMFPVTEQEKREMLSLPTRPSLTIEEQETIIENIKQFFQH